MPSIFKKLAALFRRKPKPVIRETYACSGCAFTADTFGAILTHCGETEHGWTQPPRRDKGP